ncbi:MAG: type III pantothenate kinase [Candidatus Melainabacteria bacterium]|nr:type III pantothenate kinase [Candidatus Melainabacteria bacterium]
MPYAIDLGNTALKVLFQDPNTHQTHRLYHWVLAGFTIEMLAKNLQMWQKTLPFNSPLTWVSTNPTVESQLFQHLDATAFTPLNKQRLLTPATNGGVDFSYYQASWETMGIDRVLNALHYAQHFPNETGILINAGTCTTVDILLNGKVHGGGAILAGVGTWQQALPQQAPHLPLPLVLTNGAFLPPCNTHEAITHGAGYPYAMGILAYAQQLAVYWQSPILKMVVTGGYGAWLHQALTASIPLMGNFSQPPITLILDEDGMEEAIFEAMTRV